MLINVNLFKKFWAEAMITTVYLFNKRLSSALIFKTPQEVLHGKPPNLNNLRIFGHLAYAHLSQGKLELRGCEKIF